MMADQAMITTAARRFQAKRYNTNYSHIDLLKMYESENMIEMFLFYNVGQIYVSVAM